MKNRFYISIFVALFPLIVVAQASGGQIRRPNQNHQNNPSNGQRRLPANIINNHEYVDFGLSVDIRTCSWKSERKQVIQ